MKKTLLALTVTALAATAANAATVYEQDGTKVELSGSLRTFLGKTSDDHRGDLKNDGSRVIIKASNDLGNGLSAFTGYEIRFEDKKDAKANADSDFGSPTTRQLYVGLKHKDVGALSFGRQVTNTDDVLLTDQYYYNSGALNPLTTRSDKSVKFRSTEVNGFSFGVDYLFGNENKVTATENYKHGYGAALFYNYAFNDQTKLNLNAGYSYDSFDGVNTSQTIQENSAWIFASELEAGPVTFAAAYGQTKKQRDGSADLDGDYISVAGHYQYIEPSKVYVQWERTSNKWDGASRTNEIVNHYIAGVDYKLHKNVETYVQYERTTTKDVPADERVNDNGFGVGLRVHF